MASCDGLGKSRDAITSNSATAVGVRSDGSTVFVTGESVESGSRFDYATVAHDASCELDERSSG